MDTKIIKAKNNEAGTFGATISAAEVGSATVTPVPEHAPGVIVARPGTEFEEHIYYQSKDAGAGTISGLVRDYTNLNGGTGREHINGSAWETMQASEYINNIVDVLQEGYLQEMQDSLYVSATTFTVETDRTGVYTAGRLVRLNQDNTKIGIVSSSSYSSGSGLTTVITTGVTVPDPITHVEYGIQPKNASYLSPTSEASAVNQLEVVQSATGNPVQLNAIGSDTNISLELNPKGTGVFKTKTTVQLTSFAIATDQSTGDGKVGFEVLPELDGMNLVEVRASVDTAGTTGTSDVQIRRVRSGTPADMLTTKLTVDSGETSSSTAATPAVIDAANDDVATGDMIYIDQDAVQTTKAKGGHISLSFAKP